MKPSKQTAAFVFVALASLASSLALAKPFKGGAAGPFNRPAMAVRKAEKDAVSARTIQSANGEHLVVWQAKNGDVHVSIVDAAGAVRPWLGAAGTAQPGQPLTSANGKIMGLTASKKSLLVEMVDAAGQKQLVRESITGKRAGKATKYTPKRAAPALPPAPEPAATTPELAGGRLEPAPTPEPAATIPELAATPSGTP